LSLRRWLLACLFALLPLAGWSAGPLALPALSGRVVDTTATLSAVERSALNERLAQLETEKGAQVVVLIVPTTQPESIEQYGIRLAEAWKIGRRGVNDGVIVIVARDDRAMRIEVGYGLEGAIPDAIARRIIDEQMAPRFRQGDFAGGLNAAVDALSRLIGGEALPPPAAKPGDKGSSFDSDTLLFVAIFLASIARAIFGLLGSLAVSLLAGWLAWMSFGSLLAGLIAALLTFFASFLRPGRGGGSWRGGGGGGGFSGGGGSFGGGGASGRW
jgi:uncharacterized protein